VYPKVSGLAAWNENCKWYSSLPLRASFIAISWFNLVSFAPITLCVASQRVIIIVSVHFVIDSVRKLLDTPSYYPILLTYLLTYLFHGAGYYLKSWLSLSLSKKSFLIEPEGSIPCSHKPATGPYPEPDESSSVSRNVPNLLATATC